MITSIAIVFIIALIISALFFILPSLSPIPFFPTNRKDIKYIVDYLLSDNPSHVVDLGAGTGRILFAVRAQAKKRKLPTHFISLELNPVLIFLLHIERLLFTRWHKMHVVWGNIFSYDLNKLFKYDDKNMHALNLTRKYSVYIYGTTNTLKTLSHRLVKLPTGTIIVSYMYPIPGWVQKQIAQKKEVNEIYVYRR